VINFLNARRASGEGESDESNDSLAAYGSGEEVTLSSNWAAGLENILVGSRSKDEEEAEPASVTADVALLSTLADDDVDFQVQRDMDVNVLDDLMAESDVVYMASSSSLQANSSGSVRDQLLASFFRK
jgi:hypothetical protein